MELPQSIGSPHRHSPWDAHRVAGVHGATASVHGFAGAHGAPQPMKPPEPMVLADTAAAHSKSHRSPGGSDGVGAFPAGSPERIGSSKLAVLGTQASAGALSHEGRRGPHSRLHGQPQVTPELVQAATFEKRGQFDLAFDRGGLVAVPPEAALLPSAFPCRGPLRTELTLATGGGGGSGRRAVGRRSFAEGATLCCNKVGQHTLSRSRVCCEAHDVMLRMSRGLTCSGFG